MISAPALPSRRRSRSVTKGLTQSTSLAVHFHSPQPSPRSYRIEETVSDHLHHEAGDAYCSRCHAVYHGKRWSYSTPVKMNLSRRVRVECPGCRLEREGKVGGIVRLSGEYLLNHKENILSQIRRIAEREQRRHPLARLLKLEPSKADKGFSLLTTHRTLAVLIGKELRHANHGTLKIHWSDHDPLLVEWSRQ